MSLLYFTGQMPSPGLWKSHLDEEIFLIKYMEVYLSTNVKEVKDLLAYFRLIINPNDEESLKRIINYPTRGIGTTTIQKLIVCSTNK